MKIRLCRVIHKKQADRRPSKVHIVLRSAEGTFPQITDLRPCSCEPCMTKRAVGEDIGPCVVKRKET